MANHQDSYSTQAKVVHALILAAIFIFAMFMPYLMFGIVPTLTTESADAPVTASVDVPLPEGFSYQWASPEEEAVAETDFKWCRFCHSLGEGEQHRTGPNLYKVLGATVADKPVFPYSAALEEKKDRGEIWTYEALDAYIKDPKGAVPGTRMRYPSQAVIENMLDDTARARVIKYMLINTR